MGKKDQANAAGVDGQQPLPTMSLCMIVKDEEARLGRCLDSVVGCVDEIVVVDTGSTDRTVEIATAFGARVYDHPWEGNFAKHQNQSIDYATGEWILRMDADEVLAPGSCGKMRAAIEDEEADAFLINYLSFFNDGASCLRESKIRIFRNVDEIRYHGTVHEQLRGYRNAKVLDVDTYHYGYDLKGKEKELKIGRTIALIKQEIEKDPDNHFQHLCMAQCYATNGQYHESIQEALIGLRLIKEYSIGGPSRVLAYYLLSSAYLKVGDLKNAEKHASEALAISRDHLDSYFVLTIVYHMTKNWERLYEAACGFLRVREAIDKCPEEFAFSSFNMTNEAWRVYVGLGDFYLNRKDNDLAWKNFEKAISVTPTPLDCHRMIGACFRHAGLLEDAKRHYRLALGYDAHDNASVHGLAVSLKLSGDGQGYLDLVRAFDDGRIHHAGLCVEKGIVCLKDGAYERAVAYFEKAQDLDSGRLDGQIKLAI